MEVLRLVLSQRRDVFGLELTLHLSNGQFERQEFVRWDDFVKRGVQRMLHNRRYVLQNDILPQERARLYCKTRFCQSELNDRSEACGC